MASADSIISELLHKHCKAFEKGASKLEPNEISEMIGGLHGWESTGDEIKKTFQIVTRGGGPANLHLRVEEFLQA